MEDFFKIICSLVDVSFARLLVKINVEVILLKIVENKYFQYIGHSLVLYPVLL